MTRRFTALAFALGVAITALPATSVAAPAAPPRTNVVVTSVDETMTRAVQLTLKSYGYTVVVDGIYGKQTRRAVRHWQKVHGLHVDGIAGPITQASMGLRPATATAPAVRVDPPAAAPAPSSDPIETGFGIEPGNCESFRPLMEKYGLPADQFLRIANRESKCLPNVHNGRGLDDSYGLLQINTRGNLWGELQWRCNLTSKEQLYDAETNIACAAALRAAYGDRPWSTS